MVEKKLGERLRAQIGAIAYRNTSEEWAKIDALLKEIDDSRLADPEAERQRNRAELESLREQKEYLNNEAQALQSRVAELQEQIGKPDEDLTASLDLNEKYGKLIKTVQDKRDKAEAENKRLTNENIGLKELNNGLDYCSEESDKKAKSAEARLAAAQDVLKDICHHVGKDCFATCKGDWSGTQCHTYRIFDAMDSKKALRKEKQPHEELSKEGKKRLLAAMADAKIHPAIVFKPEVRKPKEEKK